MGEQLLKILDKGILTTIIAALILVPLGLSLSTYHPYVTIKELLFHFCVLLGLFLWLAKIILTEQFQWRKSRILSSILLFGALATLSFIFFPYTDKVYFLNLLSCIIFAILVANTVQPRQIKYLLLAWILVTIPCVIYGTLQYFGIDITSFIGYFGERDIGIRVFSFFGNPNIYAAFLVVSIPIVCSSFFIFRKIWMRILLSLLLLGLLISLLLTQTRAGWIGILAASITGLGCYLLSTFPLKKKHLIIIASVAVVFLVCFSFIFYAFLTYGTDEQQDLLSPFSLKIRLNYWKNTLSIVKDHPLFGTGVGTFNVYYPAYRDKYTEYLLGEQQNEYRIEHPHNEYLEILSDLGLVGFALFIFLLWAVCSSALLSLRSQQEPFLIIGLIAAIAGILAHNFFSQELRFVVIMMFFWLLIALVSLLTTPTFAHSPSIRNINAFKIFLLIIIFMLFSFLFITQSYHSYRADQMVRKGLGAYSAQQFPLTETYLSQAVQWQKENKRAWYYLGVAQMQQQKVDEAITSFQTLLSMDPYFLSAQHYLGLVLLQRGRVNEAMDAFDKAQKTNNLFMDPLMVQASVALQLGNYDKALENYKKALWIESVTGQQFPPGVKEDIQIIFQKYGSPEEQEAFKNQ